METTPLCRIGQSPFLKKLITQKLETGILTKIKFADGNGQTHEELHSGFIGLHLIDNCILVISISIILRLINYFLIIINHFV